MSQDAARDLTTVTEAINILEDPHRLDKVTALAAIKAAEAEEAATVKRFIANKLAFIRAEGRRDETAIKQEDIGNDTKQPA